MENIENWHKPIDGDLPKDLTVVLCFCSLRDSRQKGKPYYEYRIAYFRTKEQKWMFQFGGWVIHGKLGEPYQNSVCEVLLWTPLPKLPRLTEVERGELSQHLKVRGY